MQMPYVVRQSENVVDAWSVERLQFEPKGWQRDFRADLREAIAMLPPSAMPLNAQYCSPVRDHCDTENILFYNVGTGGFAAASAHGLRFERGFSVPPCAATLDTSPLHYQRYETGREVESTFELWDETGSLAHFSSAALPRLAAESKPAGIWLALHTGHMDSALDGAWSGPFALRLRLYLPASSGSPVSLLKPLLDGVTAAFGAYEGPQLSAVSERLGAQLGLDAATVSDLLTQQEQAVLGSCQLLVSRAAGVQWQPPDDRCVACELRVERSETRPPSLEGELLAVAER